MSIRIRRATHADADGIAAIYAPFVRESHVTFEETPPDTAEIARRIEDAPSHRPWLVAVPTDDDPTGGDRVLGYAHASPHRGRGGYRWTVETSVYVDSSAHRAGVGRALQSRLLELLREAGYRVALAGVALPNDASVAFHESFGFERIATYRRVGFKIDRWVDVGWWQLDLDPSLDPPASPPGLPPGSASPA